MSANGAAIRRMGLAQHSARMARARDYRARWGAFSRRARLQGYPVPPPPAPDGG